MRNFLLSTLLLSMYNLAIGQVEITVKVIDQQTKKPIKNANVVIFGTTKGAVTNALGFFKLNLESTQKKIVISHVSYVTEPIEVPQNVNSFTVPLRKANFQFSIDLKEYPTKFDPTKIKEKEKEKVDQEKEKVNQEKETYVVVEALADYQGGLQRFKDFFGNNFNFPESELLNNSSGVMTLHFIIDKSSEYKSIRCFPDSVGALCNEFKRILTVIPKWIPAEQRGEKMDQEMKLTIFYGSNDYWKKKVKEIKKRKS